MRLSPLDESGKSVVASCVIHAVLLFGTTRWIVQPARFDVQAGAGGIEVSLIAGPLRLAESEKTAQSVPKSDGNISPNKTLEPSSSTAGDGISPVPGTDPATLYLPGGAATRQGGRFRNPAPEYPYAAIRQKQQGLVMLRAVIDKTGRPLSVEVLQSSGFSLLDESALRTVRRWKFDAAHIGFIPVQSKIVIPIRFVLEDRLSDLQN